MKNGKAMKTYWDSEAIRHHKEYEKKCDNLTSRILATFSMPVKRARVNLAIEMIAKQDDIKEVLDIGCGTGQFAVELALKRKNIKVHGIDISRKAIDLAKELAIKYEVENRVDFYVADVDASRVNFPKSDVSVGLGIIEYVKDVPLFLKNIRKSAFRLFISYPKKNHWKSYFFKAYGRQAHIKLFSAKQIYTLVESAGFKNVKILELCSGNRLKRFFSLKGNCAVVHNVY